MYKAYMCVTLLVLYYNIYLCHYIYRCTLYV